MPLTDMWQMRVQRPPWVVVPPQDTRLLIDSERTGFRQ
jgi:hypothetical protein